jgi:hypothetical protein
MKKNISLLIAAACIFLSSCNSNNNAATKATDIRNMVKQNSPGSLPTSEGGITLTAKIDGKEWKATGMMSPDKAGVIVGENNGESISLPYYDRRSFLASDKEKLGEGHGLAEMRLNDDVALWTGVTGVMN